MIGAEIDKMTAKVRAMREDVPAGKTDVHLGINLTVAVIGQALRELDRSFDLHGFMVRSGYRSPEDLALEAWAEGEL